jgi:glycerol-3-phosphate acyltransferase PlsY
MENIYFVSYVFFAYLLGSIPSGYIISKFSGKQILEIGWKKTSGSNVFKNVGKKQGIITALFDIFKGYLAVYGAQKLGMGSDIQILSGLAVVVGHNWSLFLNFSGGRGIGTFGGVLLALSAKVFALALVPIILLAIIWNAAIGTLLSLAVVVSFYIFSIPFLQEEQAKIACVFTIFCLIPIFLKRLSPIKEIFSSQNKSSLILNRLIFDDNQPSFDFRIKKIVKKLTKK